MTQLSKIFILILTSSTFAAIQPVQPKRQVSPLFFENARQLVIKPRPRVESQGALYNNYFGSLDNKIATIYHEQWVQNSSTPFAGANNDVESREVFAKQVFRMRIDQGVREYLKTLKPTNFVAQTQGALSALQNVSILSNSSAQSSKAQLRMGFDLISDSTKLEYVGGTVDFGIYKNGILAKSAASNNTVMTVTKDLGPSVGRASVVVPLTAEQIQTSISKQLSPSIATSVSSSHPLKPRQDSSYYWNVAFSF
ncbi:MAG: hypothetical protein ACKN9V_01085 [Pseudomonadota bacterium]